ncbi:hypothetical protein EBU71_15810 [bacterium]|nr:hypothetical protein [Candidatus Elulimicrobium humile]
MFRKEAFLKLSLTSVIGQLITFICLPVITRIYTPEEYGRYYLALIIVSILLPVVTMKLDIALMVNKNKALVIDLSKRLITVVSLGVISTFIVTAVRTVM